MKSFRNLRDLQHPQRKNLKMQDQFKFRKPLKKFCKFCIPCLRQISIKISRLEFWLYWKCCGIKPNRQLYWSRVAKWKVLPKWSPHFSNHMLQTSQQQQRSRRSFIKIFRKNTFKLKNKSIFWKTKSMLLFPSTKI